jgi:hypothetical protein
MMKNQPINISLIFFVHLLFRHVIRQHRVRAVAAQTRALIYKRPGTDQLNY